MSPKKIETYHFVDPTRNKKRDHETRKPGGTGPEAPSTSGQLSTASASSPCFVAKMSCSGRRCCLRKNVSSQVMRSSSASTLSRRSTTKKKQKQKTKKISKKKTEKLKKNLKTIKKAKKMKNENSKTQKLKTKTKKIF